MTRRSLALLLSVTAACGAVVAGCGSNSSSSTSKSTPASSAPASAPTTSTAAVSTTAPASSNNPAVAQGVAACKSSINAQPTLSASLKTQLTSACDKAANGDAAGVQKVTAQVCQDIVKSTVPSSAQATALAACPKG